MKMGRGTGWAVAAGVVVALAVLGYRTSVARDSTQDTAVYDPTKPLHENPRTHVGNYNREESVEIDWLSADGKSRLQMRIPSAWVMSIYGDGRGVPRGRYTGKDRPNGIYDVHIAAWYTGEPGHPIIPFKQMRAEYQAGAPVPAGTRVSILLRAEYSGPNKEQWHRGSGLREDLAYSISELHERRLPDAYGLERYRGQACGNRIPPASEKIPLLPDEEPRADCRDVSRSPETLVSTPDEADGVYYQCNLWAPTGRYGCRTPHGDYRGWQRDYSFDKTYLPQWRAMHAEIRALLDRFLVSPTPAIPTGRTEVE